MSDVIARLMVGVRANPSVRCSLIKWRRWWYRLVPRRSLQPTARDDFWPSLLHDAFCPTSCPTAPWIESGSRCCWSTWYSAVVRLSGSALSSGAVYANNKEELESIGRLLVDHEVHLNQVNASRNRKRYFEMARGSTEWNELPDWCHQFPKLKCLCAS